MHNNHSKSNLFIAIILASVLNVYSNNGIEIHSSFFAQSAVGFAYKYCPNPTMAYKALFGFYYAHIPESFILYNNIGYLLMVDIGKKLKSFSFLSIYINGVIGEQLIGYHNSTGTEYYENMSIIGIGPTLNMSFLKSFYFDISPRSYFRYIWNDRYSNIHQHFVPLGGSMSFGYSF